MIPAWLARYVNTDDFFKHRDHLPLYALIILLHEIGQFEVGRDFLLVEPPNTVVYNDGEGMYLFHQGTHRAFATFNLNHEAIRSVGLRYNDPLDQASKRRPEQITTGWEGVAQLIASAVNRSPFFGKLETIETEVRELDPSRSGFSNVDRGTISTYEIWATPRRSWKVDWDRSRSTAEYDWDAETLREVTLVDKMVFLWNRPVLLARVEVMRPVSDEMPDVHLEVVDKIEIYPQIPQTWEAEDHVWEADGTPVESESRFKYDPQLNLCLYPGVDVAWSFGHPERQGQPALKREHPFKYLWIDQTVMNFPPHSEINLSFLE